MSTAFIGGQSMYVFDSFIYGDEASFELIKQIRPDVGSSADDESIVEWPHIMARCEVVDVEFSCSDGAPFFTLVCVAPTASNGCKPNKKNSVNKHELKVTWSAQNKLQLCEEGPGQLDNEKFDTAFKAIIKVATKFLVKYGNAAKTKDKTKSTECANQAPTLLEALKAFFVPRKLAANLAKCKGDSTSPPPAATDTQPPNDNADNNSLTIIPPTTPGITSPESNKKKRRRSKETEEQLEEARKLQLVKISEDTTKKIMTERKSQKKQAEDAGTSLTGETHTRNVIRKLCGVRINALEAYLYVAREQVKTLPVSDGQRVIEKEKVETLVDLFAKKAAVSLPPFQGFVTKFDMKPPEALEMLKQINKSSSNSGSSSNSTAPIVSSTTSVPHEEEKFIALSGGQHGKTAIDIVLAKPQFAKQKELYQ